MYVYVYIIYICIYINIYIYIYLCIYYKEFTDNICSFALPGIQCKW